MKNAQSVDDGKETDWAEVFLEFIAHTSLRHEDVLDLTIPVIDSYLERLPKHLSIKLGVPFGSNDFVEPEPKPTGKPPKLSEIAAFCGGFNSVK